MLATALLAIASPAKSRSAGSGLVSRIIDEGTMRNRMMPIQPLVTDAQAYSDDDD